MKTKKKTCTLFKTAIAISNETRTELSLRPEFSILADREAKNCMRRAITPDDMYYVYFWDYENIDAAKWDALWKFLEHRRHARIDISEDGNIFTDIETCDKYGCDEEFNEILGWKAEICLWQETGDVIV